MSSQTITGINALQFTNDNERVYIYSGARDLSNSASPYTMLEFTTNSEYLVMQFQGGRNAKNSAEMAVYAYLNDELVYYAKTDNGTTIPLTPYFSQPLELIVPPFTTCKIMQSSEDADTQNATVMGIGKAYMTNKVAE